MHNRLVSLILIGALASPDLQPSTTLAQATSALVPGALKLTATFSSIGVELLFSGDDDANASAALDFRKSGEPSWRAGLPLWRTEPSSVSPGRAFYGSALVLDAGSTYEVRVTLSDPDGVSGSTVISGETRTRAEDIPVAAALVPDHFVASDGDDNNDGASGAQAWRTLDHVIKAAPPGAIVDVAPGHYAAPAPKTTRTTPLTLKAREPAAVEQTQTLGGEQRSVVVEANAGARSVIEPYGSDGAPAVSTPSGAQDADLQGLALNRIAPWQQVTLQGANDPTQTYSVWKWAGSPVVTATELGLASTRDGTPTRLANWFSAPTFDTPQKWAEQVYTHPDWRSGFWASDKDGRPFTDENGQPASTNRLDIYVRLPADANPNDGYVTVSGANMAGLTIDGPDVRVSGLELRTNERDVELRSNAARAIIDQCLLQVGYYGLSVDGAHGRDTSPATYGSDHVVQDNLFRDNGITTTDPVSSPAIPWDFIKDDTDKPGRYSETAGIAGTGGARRMVIRRNTFDGTHDGVSGYHAGFDRYSMQDADVYANYFRNLGDDAVEPSRGSINYRVWNNRFDQIEDVLSLAAPTWGPVYFFRNEAWRFGDELVGRGANGRVPGGQAIKYGAANYLDHPPAARVYIVSNTFWTDETNWLPADGVARSGDPGPEQPFLYLRNNIVRAANKAAHVEVPDRWNEDANDFSSGNPDQPAVVQLPEGRYRGNVAAYRAASGQGAHTNTRANFGTTSDADLMDPSTGDLRLKPGSALVDAGLTVANIADRAGIDFLGAAPDIGATEAG